MPYETHSTSRKKERLMTGVLDLFSQLLGTQSWASHL